MALKLFLSEAIEAWDTLEGPAEEFDLCLSARVAGQVGSLPWVLTKTEQLLTS